MKDLQGFNIDIFKLSNSVHAYEFYFDDTFFDLFENSLVTSGTGKINLSLEKTDTHINLSFEIKGTVELTCDRSLDPFDYPLDIRQKLIMKYGDVMEELSDEITMIPWDIQRINVAQYIYEFIGLDIPMKKLHPRYKEEEQKDESGEEYIYSSGNDERKDQDEPVDPRWEALKSLKKK